MKKKTLTDAEVEIVKTQLNEGTSAAQISRKHNFYYGTVLKIKRGEYIQPSIPVNPEPKKLVPIQERTKKINNVEYDANLFIPHKTDTALDPLFSIKDGGGIPKATNYMIQGDPGVGKCVHPETLVTIRIDSTGEILTLPIKEIHDMIKS